MYTDLEDAHEKKKLQIVLLKLNVQWLKDDRPFMPVCISKYKKNRFWNLI